MLTINQPGTAKTIKWIGGEKVIKAAQETESARVSQQELIPKDDLSVFQEVCSRHGVQIDVVAKEGEDYETREHAGGWGHISRKQVPKGQIYVGISSQGNLSDFWRDLYIDARTKIPPPSMIISHDVDVEADAGDNLSPRERAAQQKKDITGGQGSEQ